MRLREGLSTFIQKVMTEESMKNEEPTTSIVLKNEGGKLSPAWVSVDAPNHPADYYSLEESRSTYSSWPGTHT